MLIEIVTCVPENNTMEFLACAYTLKTQEIPFKQTHDTPRAMSLSGGKLNPLMGFVMLAPDGSLIGKNIFDLVKFLNGKGWVLC